MWLGRPFEYQIFWTQTRFFQSSFQTTIWIPDHLTTWHKFTIWIPDRHFCSDFGWSGPLTECHQLSEIGTHLVFKPQLYSGGSNSEHSNTEHILIPLYLKLPCFGCLPPSYVKHFLKKGCVWGFPFMKIVGPPWQKGEIRLGVNK